jgi:RNA polymerase sigma factor (sigma-70 family)
MESATSPILELIRRLGEDRRDQQLTDVELLGRFRAQRDEVAFHTLVRRHGRMVFDVCRNVLGNEADAEDAFQVTFLTLAQRAGAIRKQASVASWLFGVAYRTALKARTCFARRQKHEACAPSQPSSDNSDVLAWREVQQVLHEELSRLSEWWRTPLVLCYLEGKTQGEAAAALGVSAATVNKRLEQGRQRLRARLVRRGLGSTALLAAAVCPAANASAGVPISVMMATVRAASAMVSGEVPASVVSSKVVALTEGVQHTMISRKIKIGLLLVVLGIAGFAAICWVGPAMTQTPSDGARAEKSTTRATTPQTDRRTNLMRLQGAWEVVSVQGDGLEDQKALNDHFRLLTLVFKNARLVTWGMPDDVIAELKVDADVVPKRLELTQTKGLLGKDKVVHWVYELDGDRLAIAFRKDNRRPASIKVPVAGPGGSNMVRLSLRRTAADLAHWQASPGGPDAAALRMFASAAKQIEQARTVTWKVTRYRRQTADGTGQFIVGPDERHYFKRPGLYRAETIDDKQRITSINIDDVVGMRRLLIDPQKKTAVLQHLSEQRFYVEGPFPQQEGFFRMKAKSLKPIAAEKIGTREVVGYRAAFHLPREDQQWSYDFLFDAKSREMTGYRVPGLDVLDPNKKYAARTFQLGDNGFLWHDIAFNVDLNDALFSFELPKGYKLSVKGVPKVAEKDVIEFLGILADYMDGTFPRDVLQFNSGPEYLRFEKIEGGKTRQQRTPAENRMVDVMHRWWSQDVPGPGPMRLFIDRMTEEGSWHYVGGGVKRGDGTRPICWYRPRGKTAFRVIFGDLSVREMTADQLPSSNKPIRTPAKKTRGTGAKPDAPGGQSTVKLNPSKDLRYLALHLQAQGKNGRLPAKLEELTNLKRELPQVYQAIQDGAYVVIWGAPYSAEVIIAYERDVPRKGGVVLAGDGSVRVLSAEEFQTASKAGK